VNSLTHPTQRHIFPLAAGLLAGLLASCISSSDSSEKFLPGGWTKLREAPGEFLSGVDFVNDTAGWVSGWSQASGGFVLRTQDGGLTWDTTVLQGNSLESIHFWDKNTGWVVGEGGSIFKTTDGGATWVAKNSGVETKLRGMDFVSALTGWVVGDEGTLLKTTDGGDSWVGQYDSSLPYLSDVHFFNASTGIAVGHSVLRTTDGGAHWAAQTVTWADSEMFNYIDAVSFSDDKNGWAGGSFGNFLRTTDGGKTWTDEILLYDAYVTDVWKLGSGRGFMTRGNTLFGTTDDGKTWEGLEGAGQHLVFLGRNHGWAVGDYGKVYAYAPLSP
jgi:photosystem II stability/assembly factor-like uncharacterized protein